jgi:hypothetical protein
VAWFPHFARNEVRHKLTQVNLFIRLFMDNAMANCPYCDKQYGLGRSIAAHIQRSHTRKADFHQIPADGPLGSKRFSYDSQN